MPVRRIVEVKAGPQAEECRVDAYIAKAAGIPRSLLSSPGSLFYEDGELIKKKTSVKEGKTYRVEYSDNEIQEIKPQAVPLDIIYEDKDILVINKPQGLVVHPGAGNWEGTLVNALAFRYGKDFVQSTAFDGNYGRAGIVHRLDKDTSGVMVVALNAESQKELNAQFSKRSVKKTYVCICKGVFSQNEGDIQNYISRDSANRKRFCVNQTGRFAHTVYEVVRQYPSYALVSVNILTGRTHQIRVHMSYLGHSILGDPVYGRKDPNFPDATLMLHAQRLEFAHPGTGEILSFEAPLPERFERILSLLEKSSASRNQGFTQGERE